MAEIILRNIFKRFGDLVAINDLSLDIEEREFLVLLGPSGCGKTTTLRCISGLETPDEGEILIDGKDVTNKRASQRDIAFVFQLYALYPHLTVYGNIAFPLLTQRTAKKKIEQEVNRAAEILQIKHILDKKPKELSGGDMQRVALGRAIVRRPKAFLLDEPIGTLDAKFREEMRTELKKLHVDIDATTIYVTHDQVEAMSMGDRIAVMKLGVLQHVGTPNEIYSKPKNIFVAKFIGSPGMNILDCKPERDPDGRLTLRLSSTGACISIPDGIQKIILDKNEENKELVLGVRPEDVMLSLIKEENYIKTEVFVVEATGSYNIVDVKLGSSDIVKIRTLPTVAPKIGEIVYIGIDMGRISIFNKKDGNSIM
jgi:multiple sugar transport system ATP-binding protein